MKTKAGKAVGIGIAGLIGVGIAVYLLSKYGSRYTDKFGYDADPERDPSEVIISEENIEEIAQEIALEELQQVSDIELAMNEAFTQAQNAQVEVVYFQAQVDSLNSQIATEESRINSTHDPLIQQAQNDLNTAQAWESAKYSDYIVLENQMADLLAQIAAWQARVDRVELTIIYDLWKLNELNEDKNELQLLVNNAWLIYLDAQNARETEESDYNSALLAKSNDSVALDELRRQLIASTNSLNTWRIAYQASMNVFNELQTQNPYHLSTFYDGITMQNWYEAPLRTSLQFILDSLNSNRVYTSFTYEEAIAIVEEWNSNSGVLSSSTMSWVIG